MTRWSAIAVIAVSDLMFQPQIVAAAAHAGLTTRVADDPALVESGDGRRAALVVVDLQDAALDAPAVIAEAKARRRARAGVRATHGGGGDARGAGGGRRHRRRAITAGRGAAAADRRR